MSDPAERVSVIVVSWNSRAFLEGCLASVAGQTHPAVELIVVDNGSTDGSADLVRERFPRATLVRNASNTGFSAANNLGLKRAGGAYILFLNADAVLQPDYLEEALKPFAADRRVGMVAGKVLRFDRLTLDTTGQILTRGRRARERGYGRPDAGQYERGGEVFAVCGAVALVSRRMVESVSLEGEFFDEDFFAFMEDLDAGWRARNQGWICAYQPSAVALHYRGGTQQGSRHPVRRRAELPRRPPAIQAHIVMNRYLAMIKNERPGSFLVNLPFILAWDAVVWAWLLLFSPRTLPILWERRGLIARAWRKRRALRARAA
ncbi:MAG TPA: glycosyltransferase family 2 protein [Candidatus Polarisedimenticolia bacterium]|nr:glycosyltransferase family 2 protein [Candidatus Polarisedimenticolia bacterium]